MKLSALIILYNPEHSVLNNIKTYIEDVQTLYIFDNSNVITKEIEEIKKIEKVVYLTCGENKGIGYALNYVCKLALKDGFDWILVMDQDSFFEKNGVRKIINAFEKQNNYNLTNTGIISPVIIYDNNKEQIEPKEEFERLLITINSGSIINFNVFKIVGDFRSDYFLDRIDFEYSLRLNKFGYNVLRCNNAFLYHRLGNLKIYNFLGFKIRVTNHSPIRHYYMTKNAIDIVKNYFFDFPSHCLYEIKSIFADFLKILLFENNKYEKIKKIFQGFFDSFI